MLFNDDRKFYKEIGALKRLGAAVPPLAAQRQAELKAVLLSRLGQTAKAEQAKFFWWHRHLLLLRYVVAVLAGLSIIGGTAYASGGALPGDTLYPVKLATEQVRLTLALTPEAKVSLQTRFAQTRLQELQQLSERLSQQSGGMAAVSSTPVAAPAGGASLSAAATDSADSLSPDNLRLRIRAEEKARQDVGTALENLQQLQAQAQASGDSRTASSLRDSILNLRQQAQQQNIVPDDGSEHPVLENLRDRMQEQRQNAPATATPPSSFLAPTSTVRAQGDVQGQVQPVSAGGSDGQRLDRLKNLLGN
ncbi:MAG TPA: DUF5667 domain-containing protein [Patescibacteria group bacterium]|nr:DUF5667 domain-containing protein [Patescibacteria group bacterium]